MSTSELLWAEFNGCNHAELGIKYRLSVQQVYTVIKQARAQAQRSERIKALEAVLTGQAANATLPANLLFALTLQAWQLKAYRLFLRLLWRRLNARLFGASLPGHLHRHQSERLLNIPARSIALRVLDVVRSFHSPDRG